MKLHVAYGNSGEILAAAELIDEKSARIQPGPGEQVAEFDVPPKFAGTNITDFVHLLRVDTSRKELTEG